MNVLGRQSLFTASVFGTTREILGQQEKENSP